MLLLSYVSLRSLMFLLSNPTHRNINQQVSPPSFVSDQSLPVNGIWSRRVLLFQCVRFSACVALAKRTRLRARQSSQPSRQQSAIQTGPHSWPAFPALPLSRSRPGAHEGDPCPLRRRRRRRGENGPRALMWNSFSALGPRKLWKALSYPLAWVPRSL